MVANVCKGAPRELRLKTIADGVRGLLAEHEPDAVAIEESYVGADARIALSVGQARGAVLVVCADAGVDCTEYAPASVKQAVCGYGRADKEQVQKMVKAILSLRRAAAAEPRRRRAGGRDLPRARAAAREDGGPVIAQLRGQVVRKGPGGLVLDVGGVGYLVQPTQSVLGRARDGELTVHTYLHVREDALQLYGFAEPSERELFEQLLSVSGIGPKVALSIVSGSSPDELRRAIALEDTARFEAIPGIGKKIAQRVVLELKEKLAAGMPRLRRRHPAGQHLVAREALVELGYSVVEAEQALAAVDPELPPRSASGSR